ncbi:MAG: GTPase [Micromonosporaceae bacterium]|jgi:energy-coupling factor transporter ATP-binding protein EcfA2
MNGGESLSPLIGALRTLRAEVAEAVFPAPLPSAEGARATARAVAAQVDDHLLPRLEHLDAPLLVVVGGPTGAGKSTLINSLIRAPASPTGVVRPTTRSPVLLCNPADSAWFRSHRVLPRHRRTSGPATEPDQLHLITAPALPTGCAFIDTPDIDSVVLAHHEAAAALLNAADLWLFVTTAARYADAVPWDLLQVARDRGAVIALALNRTTPGAEAAVTAHLTEMLKERGLEGTPLFVLPETRPDGHGLLPDSATEQLRTWFDTLTADPDTRRRVVRQTLAGALAALPSEVARIAAAVDDQVAAAENLAEQVGVAYGAARAAVERAIEDGTLAQGEVLARWQAFAGSAEFRLGSSPAGRLRQRWRSLLAGRRRAGWHLVTAVETAVAALVRSAVINASEQAHRSWQADVAGAALLAPEAGPDLSAPAATAVRPDSSEDQVGRVVRQWRRDMRDLVRHEVAPAGASHPSAVNAVLAAVLVAAIAPEVVPPTAQVPAALVERAREELLDRVRVLLDQEAARYLDRVADVLTDGRQGQRLREAAAEVEKATVVLREATGGPATRRAVATPTSSPAGRGAPTATPSPASREAPKVTPASGNRDAPKLAAALGGRKTPAAAPAAGGREAPEAAPASNRRKTPDATETPVAVEAARAGDTTRPVEAAS